MLVIATDLTEVTWLRYIIEEFIRINQPQFPIHLVGMDEIPSGIPVIYYTRELQAGICLPNRAQIYPDGNILWVGPDIFIVPGTLVTEKKFACLYDIFWNAFVFLSRMEEFWSEKKGRKIYSYSFRHPRQDKKTFQVPVVNHLFEILEKIIKANFPGLSFAPPRPPVIELSHDVDYLEKTWQLRLKQLALNCHEGVKSLATPSHLAKIGKKTFHFMFSRPSYWCFDYWREVETRINRRSVFYVFVNLGKKDLVSWLLDPSYSLTSHRQLQETLKRLQEDGFEIGLHGSWRSAVGESVLSQEKELLEKIMNIEVKRNRQHWLRYEEWITPRLHSKMFKFDSTLGWNDVPGFRSGCASLHRPYNHEDQKPFQHLVIPLVIMDAQLFHIDEVKSRQNTGAAISLIKNLFHLKNVYVSICWHQRSCSPDYNWHKIYERIIIGEI